MLVYELTGDEAKLALVTFCGMAPTAVLGPFAGTLADTFNKRNILIATQACMSAGALFLAAASYFGFIAYWHILGVALMFGIVGCFEMPTRQSILGKVVPPEEISAAVPLNALTFNVARIVGPGIGAILYIAVGPQLCYGINGISYLGLILAATLIRADLRPVAREAQPVLDLLLEGMRYTFKDLRLRTLFVMEAIVSAFGIAYLALMPAFARQLVELRHGAGFAALPELQVRAETSGLVGGAMTSVGVGAIMGLLLSTSLAHKPGKAKMIMLSMTSLALGLMLIPFARTPWVAFPLFAVLGGSSIIQFNTTNSLFQLLSPERLRGRVIAMHVWALAGLGPFGMLLFGYIARESKGDPHSPFQGVPLVMLLGGLCVGAGLLWSYRNRKNLEGVP
jgi:MFS family permease